MLDLAAIRRRDSLSYLPPPRRSPPQTLAPPSLRSSSTTTTTATATTTSSSPSRVVDVPITVLDKRASDACSTLLEMTHAVPYRQTLTLSRLHAAARPPFELYVDTLTGLGSC
ncbi:hypothetical protein PLICRDRAFT_42851 [Plicaturopsis crispa FD-325 SS-3]|nr:hypothetical protein PLICRDRAFT_42851 [Plicaturopsis crispa FD-325 SS-3]